MIKCWKPRCKGIPHAINDGASRVSEGYFGRIHYVCDRCGTRWSLKPESVLKSLPQTKKPVRRL